MKFGRDQEMQSDLYGTRYMKAAGYDPTGAVTLQETFVRLSEGKTAGMFEQWFSSHPPSQERVDKNRQTVAELGAGGEMGLQRFQAQMAALNKAKPAYDKYDQAVAALEKKDYAKAKSLAGEASQLFPTEGSFHELMGEIEFVQKNYQAAIPHYERAIQYNPNYFGSYLGGGIAQAQVGNKAKAREWLAQSQKLLPTEPAEKILQQLGP
jgi:predicted Zn-dependent protease